MKPKFFPSSLLSVSLAAIVLSSARGATPISWTGGNGNWQDGAKWSLGVEATIAHDVTLNSAGVNGDQTILLNGVRFANSITSVNTGSTTILSGGSAQTIAVGTGGITLASGSGALTIGSGDGNGVRTRLTGGSVFTFDNQSTSLLWLRNTLAPADSVEGAVTLNVTGSGNTSFSEGVNNGVGANSVFGIVKSGSGTLDLSGVAASNFSGGVAINGGTVITNSNGRLGNTSGTLSFDGGTLRFTENISSSDPAFRLNRATTINAGGATYQVDAGKTVQNIGVISGTGQLIKTGEGTLALWTVDNTYEGGTRIDQGVLDISGNSRLGKADSTVTINGGTLRTATSITTLAGVRPIEITAAGGAIEVAGESTVFRHEGTISGAGALTKTGSGTIYLVGDKSYAGGTNLNGGTVLFWTAGRLGSGNLTFDGGRLQTNHDSLTLNKSAVLNAGGGILSGQAVNSRMNFTGSIFGAGGLGVNGLGTVEISGVNSYTGATSVTQGTLVVKSSINSSTALNVSGGTFRFGASNVVSDSALVTMGEGGVMATNNFSDMLGALAVNGTATIDLSGGESLLHFASSNTQTWTGTLSFTGWTGLVGGGDTEGVFFGSGLTGLTTDQLGRISFVNPEGLAAGTYSARILETGEVVPFELIPEPSAVLLALFGAGGFVTRRRR